MKQPEQPWEFRSKPAWQRLLIMVGGVLFNFLLALFIYSCLLYTSHPTYACFTPFLRNRDNNRDGQMQANEMQWYIPSICEANM